MVIITLVPRLLVLTSQVEFVWTVPSRIVWGREDDREHGSGGVPGLPWHSMLHSGW